MQNIKIIFKLYILSIAIFSVFRLIFFFTEFGSINPDTELTTILFAFLIGLRFDVVISSYILILPFVLLSINAIPEKDFKKINKIVFVWCCILSIAAFLICAIDIPYFNHFFTRLTYSSFDAITNGDASFIFSMISEEIKYWIYFGIFVLMSVSYFIFSRKFIFKTINTKIPITKKGIRIAINSLIFAVAFVLIFFGIRGRFAEKSPIRVGTAYFSNDNFLNQFGLNPNFTLLASFFESFKPINQKNNFMDDNEAIRNMQQYLKIENIIDTNNENIFARRSNFDNNFLDKKINNPNVVLIVMESMSCAKMSRYGNTKKLTPFLDSIANISYCFENIYSSTGRTYGGIFSTLFSMPVIWGRNPMKIVPLLKFQGLSSVLKKNNYSTIYFTTHDGQFDGIEGFLYKNDFEKIVEQAQYPINEIKTTMGVPDDYMFRFSMPILNELNSKNKPFFATFLTGSDHLPFYIPNYFTPTQQDIKDQAVEYADYSLRNFIELCSKEKWYDNTIFVFVADHGKAIDVTYNIPLTFFHIPFIIFVPNQKNNLTDKQDIFSNIGSQIDVGPTILGMLGIDYVNNSLGVNLFNESREFAVLDATTKYGVISKDWFLIVDKEKNKSLYKYTKKDKQDYSNNEREIANNMDLYAKSYFQSFDYLLRYKQKHK
jgi:phosphoglycerol transferase MdoB-like AlkP superfamily enzyme